MRAFKQVLAAGTLSAFAAAPATAGDDVAAGRRLVDDRCASCHRIADSDPARHPQAPSLTDVAGRYPPRALEEAFAEGMTVGHPDMPAFAFTADETRKLIRFLESLEP